MKLRQHVPALALIFGIAAAVLWPYLEVILPAQAAYPTTVTVQATGSAVAVTTGGVYYPAPQWGNLKSYTISGVPFADALVLTANGWYIIPPTMNRGLAALACNGATKTFTIAHLLGTTPASVWAIPASSAVSGVSYTASADGTNITITFGPAPAASACSMYWGATL